MPAGNSAGGSKKSWPVVDSDEESVVPLPPNKKKHMNDGKVKAETTVEAVVSCVR